MSEKGGNFGARDRGAIIVLLLFVLLTGLFVFTPWSGDDWETFRGAGERVLHRDSLYGSPVTVSYYSNPPWLAVILAPFALIPEKLGWAMVSAGTLLAIMALLQHWQRNPGIVKVLLALLSPPTTYMLMHGEIDALVLALVLLPAEWRLLAAVTKPQVTIGLAVGIPLARWRRTLLLTAGVVLVSLLLFGWWPRDLLDQPTPFREGGHNFWAGLWPFQVPLGVALLAVGGSRRDDRLLIAGSPFLSPYAAMSSFLGPWLAALTYLKTWQAALVWASWWGAVVYRAFV